MGLLLVGAAFSLAVTQNGILPEAPDIYQRLPAHRRSVFDLLLDAFHTIDEHQSTKKQMYHELVRCQRKHGIAQLS